MARIKLPPIIKIFFSAEIPVRIGDINYGGHLGNDAVLSLIQEARVQALKSRGYSEIDVGDNAGLIMADAVVVYRGEAFYGDVISIDVGVEDLTETGFDFVYKLTSKKDGKNIAQAKTSMVFFDYEKRRPRRAPENFISVFSS